MMSLSKRWNVHMPTSSASNYNVIGQRADVIAHIEMVDDSDRV